MNVYLFDRAKYDRLYNCSILTSTEWESRKNPMSVIGSLNIITVTIYQSLYFVFLLTMLRKLFWQHSCYKIMFVLGVCDVGATLIGGTFAGIFAIRGDIFCTNQTAMYLVGCVEEPIWSACCVNGLILLLNRAVNLVDEKYAHALFGKSKVYVWLMIPFGIFFHCYFFTTPYLFNSLYGAAFLNPYMGVPEIQGDFSEYDNPFSEWFGYFVSVMYPLMYLVLCAILWYKTRSSQNGINSTQIQITVQSVAVSILLAIVSSSYVTIQFIEIPKFMIVALQFMWMASHGASVFTYIFINKSMRKEAGKMVQEWLIIAKCGSAKSEDISGAR